MSKVIGLWNNFLLKIIPYYGTVYKKIGGQKIIDVLVDDFYRTMMSDPRAAECLATHAGKDMNLTAAKLKDFLSGWLGGPQLFVQKYGHPALRRRHLPFSIGEIESEQWLYCMKVALKKSQIEEKVQAELMEAFFALTERIKNKS